MLETPWTAERVGLLVGLWDEKVGARLIAARINRETGSAFTKNAIIGKANRRGLSTPIERPKSKPPHWNARYRTQLLEHRVLCMWPIGHPGDADFHFCGAKPLPEKPYCRRHHDAEHERAKKEAAKRQDRQAA
ncbi:MAG: GcrA family cell cycle regulator [bacterium]|nr:GcrA family cell cycle regulator [bacterium]